jgi:hypothetical protein
MKKGLRKRLPPLTYTIESLALGPSSRLTRGSVWWDACNLNKKASVTYGGHAGCDLWLRVGFGGGKFGVRSCLYALYAID